MIQIAVVSGKGGTGKTVITGAIGSLLSGRVVMADCDVDAANLALIIQPDIDTTEPFFGMDRARIDTSLCNLCETCIESCRFDAITRHEDYVQVDPLQCEGCGVCEYVCPSHAITMVPHTCGEIRTGHSRYGPFIDGSLFPGNGNSGLMVHDIRKRAREIAPDIPLILVDGPPGIGCPLISAVTGCDIVILVTEPGSSGRHDLGRLVTVCRSLRSRMMMIINKADLVPKGTLALQESAKEWDIPILCEIPLDPGITEATRNCEPFTRKKSQATVILKKAVDHLKQDLDLT